MKKILLLAVFLNLLIATAAFAQTSTISQLAATSSDNPSSAFASAPFRNPSLPIAERVDDLVSRMTLEEKVEQMVQALAGYTRDGMAFPVDTRLRPRGAEGELLVTPVQLAAYFRQ